jgi:DNA topoisomerase-1
MEKLGLGTKSTRHSIIERLSEVRYIKDDPIQPTQLGIAIIDALKSFAPRITSPEMTSELEAEMTAISEGDDSFEHVVGHSRELLFQIMGTLIPKKDELGDLIAEAATNDAKVGVCDVCGSDLLLKYSPKTRSSFVGCAGYPDCDVTYAVPQGKIEQVDESCPVCGKSQISLTPFRSKAMVRCIDPACPSNQVPEVDIGLCPECAKSGKESHLFAKHNPKTLKRFVRCENYAECNTSYPLPQNGELAATDETCAECGAPKVCIRSKRGDWVICPNPDCPENGLNKDKAAKGGASAGAAGVAGAKKAPAKRGSAARASAGSASGKGAGAKKAAAKKAAAKKSPAKKASAKKSPGTSVAGGV